MALNYDYMTATTREYFENVAVDNIYKSSSFLKTMLIDGRIKKYVRGGRKIVDPIKYAKMGASGTYSDWDTFDVTPPDNITAAEHTWGNYYASVAISGDDEDQNMGDNMVINLLNDRQQEATQKMKDDLAVDLFEGGGGKALVGIDTAIAAGTYGGIAGASYSWWQSGSSSTARTRSQLIDPTDTTNYINYLFQAADRSALALNEVPNLIVTTPLIWDIYEGTLQADARYPKTGRGQKIADGGMDVIEWRSRPIIKDELCPAGYVYFLNTKFMTLYTHPNKYFKFTGFKVATNQDGRVGQVLTKIQLGVNNRRMHYKYSGWPTS